MFNHRWRSNHRPCGKRVFVEVLGETKVIVHVYPEKHQGTDYDWGFDVEDDDFEDLDPDFLDHKKGK